MLSPRKIMASRIRDFCIWVSALPLPTCVTLFWNLSEPVFSPLSMSCFTILAARTRYLHSISRKRGLMWGYAWTWRALEFEEAPGMSLSGPPGHRYLAYGWALCGHVPVCTRPHPLVVALHKRALVSVPSREVWMGSLALGLGQPLRRRR